MVLRLRFILTVIEKMTLMRICLTIYTIPYCRLLVISYISMGMFMLFTAAAAAARLKYIYNHQVFQKTNLFYKITPPTSTQLYTVSITSLSRYRRRLYAATTMAICCKICAMVFNSEATSTRCGWRCGRSDDDDDGNSTRLGVSLGVDVISTFDS